MYFKSNMKRSEIKAALTAAASVCHMIHGGDQEQHSPPIHSQAVEPKWDL